MEVTWCIDWISATFKNTLNDAAIRNALSFGFPRKAWTETTPRYGYKHALQHPLGHMVMFNPGRPEMGVHIQMGGRSLREMAAGGHDAVKMLAWVSEQGGRVTRLDLAIDVKDEPIDLIALATCPRVKDAPGSARKWSQVQGSDGGQTVYVGSRQSEKFLRVYDKRIESGQLDRAWTRFELEIKGDTSRVVAAEFLGLPDGDRSAYIRGVMRAMFNPDDKLFQSIMDAPTVLVSAGKQTDDNTLEWLLQTVSKTLAKTILRRSDVDVWAEFAHAVNAQMNALDRPDEA